LCLTWFGVYSLSVDRRGGNTVAESLPQHPKAKGLSPATVAAPRKRTWSTI